MNEQPFILDFDENPHAVLEPSHEKELFHFHSRLLYAFVSEKEINAFLDKHLHRTLGEFESVSFNPKIYEVQIDNEFFTLCQAPLGAPAAVQLLEWLITYGVETVLTIGTAGALNDLPENEMFLVKRAIRDEGTSFHYMDPGQFVDLDRDFLKQVEKALSELNLDYDEVTTWTTDGFFRETPNQVLQAKELGAKTVEMECSALAACAEFRNINFAQILFTADSLADMDNYDKRNWGHDSYSVGLNIGSQVLVNL